MHNSPATTEPRGIFVILIGIKMFDRTQKSVIFTNKT